MGDQRAETRLALPSMQVLGERGAFDGKRDLRGQGDERVDELSLEDMRRGQDEEPAALVTRRKRQEEEVPALDDSELAANVLGQTSERNLLAAPGRFAKPRARRFRQLPLSGPLRRSCDERDTLSPKHQTDGDLFAGECSDGRYRCRVHLLAPAGCHELDARRPQGELARGRLFLLSNQAGHAHDDEQEQDCGCRDQHESVRVPERLVEADTGRNQAGPGEESEADWGQPRTRVQRGLFERAHGRMKRGCSPEEVVGDPADVVDELVVVGVGEQRERVGGVDREQRDDAGRKEVEGRRSLAHVDRETDRRCEQKDVPQWVCGGDHLLGHRQAGEVNVRSNEEDPRQEADSDRQDPRVDHGGPVSLGVAPPDQEEEPGYERRVDGQIERISERRELDVGACQLRIAVRVEIAGEEEELADDEEQPRRAGPRPMEVDPHRDRDRGREAEEIDERTAGLEGRYPEIRRR